MAGTAYYEIIPCCSSYGTATDYFLLPVGQVVTTSTTGAYNGAPVTINGLTFATGQCYTIIPAGTMKFPPYATAPSLLSYTIVTDCTVTRCLFRYYTLYSCSGLNTILTASNLIDYVDTFVNLVGETDCFFVVEGDTANCEPSGLVPVTVNTSSSCECDCNCYQITGTPSSVFYIDCDLVPQTVTGAIKVCSVIPPIVTGGSGFVYDYGLCIDNECPVICYEFTNCQTEETLIVSNTPSISTYFVDNKTVTLQGYDGCWTIALAEEPCDCAINVTILQAFDDCPTCLPIIAYKFTNCANASIIKYSTDDYEAYIGKVVRLDCGECWTVELINYTPPAVQPIVIITSFESCVACNRTYYTLVDCTETEDAIYTYTDLSLLVGKTINIKSCLTCWRILNLPTPTPEQALAASEVTITGTFNTCKLCDAAITCQCSVAWPDELGNLSYIDCYGDIITLEFQDPNTPSEKVCVKKWLIGREPIYFEDCINVSPIKEPVYECPPPVYPKRFIEPGYTTPTCDTEKYEKISCNAAEILYKSVLRLRYGISNCCDEPDDKWIIKKELIDLQAAVDPNYTCTPVQTCCNNTSTCSCGTCNSR
jgi:hypothetical protein